MTAAVHNGGKCILQVRGVRPFFSNLAGSASLGALRLSPERKESAIRFSFCEFTTKEEIDYTLEALRKLLPMLRRYARK